MLFDRDNTTLTCTSTGGPPTSVTWWKNGVPINTSLYQHSQRVVDTESATYENVLFDNGMSNFVGTFTCEVGNVRGMAQDTVELNGQLDFVNFFSIILLTLLQVCLLHVISSLLVVQLMQLVKVTL